MCNVLAGRSEWLRLLGKPKHGWNVKVGPKEMKCEVMGWIHLALSTVQWDTFVYTAMALPVPHIYWLSVSPEGIGSSVLVVPWNKIDCKKYSVIVHRPIIRKGNFCFFQNIISSWRSPLKFNGESCISHFQPSLPSHPFLYPFQTFTYLSFKNHSFEHRPVSLIWRKLLQLVYHVTYTHILI
jgi:hypothetical protein